MTVYRLYDSVEEEEDIDNEENLQQASREQEDRTESNYHKKTDDEELAVVSEVVEPKVAEITKQVPDKLFEVHTEKMVFKTKCQLMQEDVENGMYFVILVNKMCIFLESNSRKTTCFNNIAMV